MIDMINLLRLSLGVVTVRGEADCTVEAFPVTTPPPGHVSFLHLEAFLYASLQLLNCFVAYKHGHHKNLGFPAALGTDMDMWMLRKTRQLISLCPDWRRDDY